MIGKEPQLNEQGKKSWKSIQNTPTSQPPLNRRVCLLLQKEDEAEEEEENSFLVEINN